MWVWQWCFNPSNGEAEAGGFLGLFDQPVWPDWRAPAHSEIVRVPQGHFQTGRYPGGGARVPRTPLHPCPSGRPRQCSPKWKHVWGERLLWREQTRHSSHHWRWQGPASWEAKAESDQAQEFKASLRNMSSPPPPPPPSKNHISKLLKSYHQEASEETLYSQSVSRYSLDLVPMTPSPQQCLIQEQIPPRLTPLSFCEPLCLHLQPVN